MEVLRGKYQIVREIARSNDIVYEATDQALGRRIALKELNLGTTLSGQEKVERMERFRREARAAGRLSHPNIVSVFDYGEENGRHFIAMEFLEGQSLRDRMHAVGALGLRDALEITYQLLDALAYAHQNRVVHRDIKPDNIHILPGGQVKLTDFGIARLTEESGLTSAGQVFGTPSYMSPEQIEGKPIDARSDLFSVGILLYEMLAGRKPFVGDNVVAITYAIMNAPAPPLSGVPAGIEGAINQAMAKNPLHRFSSAEAMKAELRRAESAPAVYAPSGSTGMSGYPALTGGYQIAGLPQVMPPAAYPPSQNLPPGAGASGSQPWAFNNGNPGLPSGPNSGGARSAALNPLTQIAGGVPPGGFGAIPGQNLAAPPFHVSRPPSLQLSPGAKTFLLSLLIASVLGGGIALGFVAFLRGYDNYKASAGSEKIAALLAEGAKAYKDKNYSLALQKFEAAKHDNKDKLQEKNVNYNLAATLIALGNDQSIALNWKEAEGYYDRALEVAEGGLADTARRGRANALEQLGQKREAAQDRAASGSGDSRPPESLPESHTPTREEWMGERQQKARALLNEAEALERTGDRDGARKKWIETTKTAPGTPESDRANQRLSETQETFHVGDAPPGSEGE